MVGQEILEVLYSPVKAFKKIIEKPDFKAIILILILSVAATFVAQYVLASKLSIESRLPQNDDWTESLTNQHLWVSNGVLSLDDGDYKLGNEDGNHSLVCSVNDASQIHMTLTGLNSDVSEQTQYREFFFWIKWTNENNLSPTSATIKLLSGSETSYFESDITDLLAEDGIWTNITLTISSSLEWTSNNAPDWGKITGIDITLDWESSANSTIKIDGLFFREFVTPTETEDFAALAPSIILQLVLDFAMNWILWAGIVILVAKLFNEELGQWSKSFVVLGYSFIATVVYTSIQVLPLSVLPMLTVPLELNALNVAIASTWSPLFAYQLWVYIPIIGQIWIAGLSAVAIRVMNDIPWNRAAIIASVAFGLRLVLNLYLRI
ncbi:MAG: hypothetical protein QCH99_06665 [Candidatus Bathyarchaeota archaeon]|nr:hypothetical protein [Candidatus Bathyarchaeum tardum]